MASYDAPASRGHPLRGGCCTRNCHYPTRGSATVASAIPRVRGMSLAGWSPSHLAASCGRPELASLLATVASGDKRRASPNRRPATPATRQTPVHGRRGWLRIICVVDLGI